MCLNFSYLLTNVTSIFSFSPLKFFGNTDIIFYLSTKHCFVSLSFDTPYILYESHIFHKHFEDTIWSITILLKTLTIHYTAEHYESKRLLSIFVNKLSESFDSWLLAFKYESASLNTLFAYSTSNFLFFLTWALLLEHYYSARFTDCQELSSFLLKKWQEISGC